MIIVEDGPQFWVVQVLPCSLRENKRKVATIMPRDRKWMLLEMETVAGPDGPIAPKTCNRDPLVNCGLVVDVKIDESFRKSLPTLLARYGYGWSVGKTRKATCT